MTLVIVGAGHRGVDYAGYALHHSEKAKVVGVADPIEHRRRAVADRFGLTASQCFRSAEELAARGKIADAAINGTMDSQHVSTSLALLAAGYDVLLEKPLATNEQEMFQLLDAVRQTGRRIMICHVLRYAPFYRAIFDLVAAGRIGQIINIQLAEHVSYHHTAVGYVRGKWNRRDVGGSSMLMAKCCHDLDLLAWMKTGVRPVRVASFGSLTYFRPERAPRDAGSRCLVDCPIESACDYSVRKHYLDHPLRWAPYVWQGMEHQEDQSIRAKTHYLCQSDNPYGRCVWKCDNDVVDHQSLLVEFEDGGTATFNMVGNATRPQRSIHLLGTDGEIAGIFEDSRFVVRSRDVRAGHEYAEEIISIDEHGDMHGATGGHGGGDLQLVADFVNYVRGEPASPSCTSLHDSISGHLIGFQADRAMVQQQALVIPPW